MDDLARNLAEIREQISRAARRSGREASEIELMAVTKTVERARIMEAYDAGIRLFGENRVQEAVRKYQERPPDLKLHMIGHLQRNKAATAATMFNCVESIDKIETAQSLERRCAAAGVTMHVLLEINTSKEESKSGFMTESDLYGCCDYVLGSRSLRLRGLMTIGPLTQDERRVRTAFQELRTWLGQIQKRWSPVDFSVLSMGMSGDYSWAVEEGSTQVRIGTALFGERSS